MKKLVLIGFAVLTAVSLATAANTVKKTPGQLKVEQLLKEIVIPVIDVREANVFEIVDILNQRVLKNKDLCIVVGVPASKDSPLITLNMKNISLGEAVRFITELSGLSYRIDDNGVVITRKPTTAYRAEASMSPTTEPGQYMVGFKIYRTDSDGKEECVGAPELTTKVGREVTVLVGGDGNNGLTCKAFIVETDDGGMEATTRFIIEEAGKDKISSAQTIVLKKKNSGVESVNKR